MFSLHRCSAVDSGAGGARAPLEFGDSEKGRSLISVYRSLAITANTPGFNKLSTALHNGVVFFLKHQLFLCTPHIVCTWIYMAKK